jgi:hypothetical protein
MSLTSDLELHLKKNLAFSEYHKKLSLFPQKILMDWISEADAIKELYNTALVIANSKNNSFKEPIFSFMVELINHSIRVEKKVIKLYSFSEAIKYRKETKMFFKLCSSLLVVINNEADTLLKNKQTY